MKRLKSIASLAAGLLLAGTMLGQSALAQPPETGGNNSTTVYVTVGNGGVFDAYFCDLAAAPSPSTPLTVISNPSATTAGQATGTVVICYTDTMAYRPSFDTKISSTNFVNGTFTIAASNFSITKTTGVAQTRCTSNFPSCGPYPGTGDIGAYQDELYVAQNSGPWTWSPGFTLDTGRKVQFGYAGIGTVLSGGAVDVSLKLPIGTASGTYTSTLTLSVVAGQP